MPKFTEWTLRAAVNAESAIINDFGDYATVGLIGPNKSSYHSVSTRRGIVRFRDVEAAVKFVRDYNSFIAIDVKIPEGVEGAGCE